MKIAVASEDGRGLSSFVSPHFGRCPFYTLVDVQDGEIVGVEVCENPYYGRHVPGAVPEFVRGLGADIIIAGGMGPRAMMMFESFGIEVVTVGWEATVQEAVEAYLEGELRGAKPCEGGHHHGFCEGR